MSRTALIKIKIKTLADGSVLINLIFETEKHFIQEEDLYFVTRKHRPKEEIWLRNGKLWKASRSRGGNTFSLVGKQKLSSKAAVLHFHLVSPFSTLYISEFPISLYLIP